MKICPHCSAQLEDDAVKCRRCGRWLVKKNKEEASKKKAVGGRVRLLLLGILAVLAWVLWAAPERKVNPRKILDLGPSPAAALATMRGDLETLQALQKEYQGAHGQYSGDPDALGFTPSEGVSLSLVTTPGGWSAAATHEEHGPELGCAVFEGSILPPRSPVHPSVPGSVICSGSAS